MKKIGALVAIGGGEIGRPGTQIETRAIDAEIVRLSGKKHPRLLFIPTASDDSVSYYEIVKKYFTTQHGCVVDVLYLSDPAITTEVMKHKVSSADIVYVGGGNTYRMVRRWKRYGLDALLVDAYAHGAVLSGVSAGAICWFASGQSDSRKSRNKNAPYIMVSGLGICPLKIAPHFDVETGRRKDLNAMLAKRGGHVIALDNCSALVVVRDTFTVLTSRPGAHVRHVYHQRGMTREETLHPKEIYTVTNYIHS